MFHVRIRTFSFGSIEDIFFLGDCCGTTFWPSAAPSGSAAPSPALYIGKDEGPGRRTGLHVFNDIPEISLVCAPGQTDSAIQDAVISHCENNKYRFAILDSAEELGKDGIAKMPKPRDSQYAAYYFPWIQVYDPEKGNVYVPPSGHMAGIYARSDAERGVHKAPANEIVRGALGLRYTISRPEQDFMNPRGINCIRNMGDRGIRIWGARTISSDPSWRYINVRRLFLMVEQSIEIRPINEAEINALPFNLTNQRLEIFVLGERRIADVIGNLLLLQEIENVLAAIHPAGQQRTFLLAEIEERDVTKRDVVEIEVTAKVKPGFYQLAQPAPKNSATRHSRRQKTQRTQKAEWRMFRIINEVAPVAMLVWPRARDNRGNARGAVTEHRGEPPPVRRQRPREWVVLDDFPPARIDENKYGQNRLHLILSAWVAF